MEKIGKHYYADGEKVSWGDTFEDEEDDIRDKIYGIQFDIIWLCKKFTFAVKVMMKMALGFFD